MQITSGAIGTFWRTFGDLTLRWGFLDLDISDVMSPLCASFGPSRASNVSEGTGGAVRLVSISIQRACSLRDVVMCYVAHTRGKLATVMEI